MQKEKKIQRMLCLISRVFTLVMDLFSFTKTLYFFSASYFCFVTCFVGVILQLVLFLWKVLFSPFLPVPRKKLAYNNCPNSSAFSCCLGFNAAASPMMSHPYAQLLIQCKHLREYFEGRCKSWGGEIIKWVDSWECDICVHHSFSS